MNYKKHAYNRLLIKDFYNWESDSNGNIVIKQNVFQTAQIEGDKMLYEDKNGRLMMPEEVEDLSLWEIEDLGIYVIEMLG